MRVKTTVGQVALVSGGRSDQPGNILVDERSSPLDMGRRRGNLYIVVDITGPEIGRDVVARQAVHVMRDAYHARRGSVTAGLQRAVQEANSFLLEENRNSLPGEHRTAGVSCVVLRDGDLFVAQVGPAAVYLAQGGRVQRFPDVSPWLDDIPLEEMDAVPLGERRDINVTLSHAQLVDGDTVLLVDGELARRVPSETWSHVMARAPFEAAMDELLAAGKGRDLSAVMLRLGEEDVGPAPARPPVAVDAVEPPRTRARSGTGGLAGWLAQAGVAERVRGAGRALVAILGGLWVGLINFLRRMVPDQFSSQQTLRRQPSTVKKTGTKTARPKRARTKKEAPAEPIQRMLIGIAIAIPIIVAVIVIVTLISRGQTHRAELEALWQDIDSQWQQAGEAADPAVIRTHLAEADRLLVQYLDIRPDEPEAVELRSKVQARLDVINQVKRISWIGELNSYAAGASLSRVVVQGAHVFVLDRNEGKVYHHQLDEQLERALKADSLDTVLVRRGDQVGDVLVGDLMDMVWMPTGPNRQKASLVVLESGGALLDYDPATGELLPLQVAASDTWQYPQLVGSHSGRFYLLDSTANMIWRYDPTPDGYSNPPAEWLQTQVDLAGVVDMAIGDSIYLAYADGKISKLTVGAPDSFDIADWDAPPRSPAAIFTRPPEETQWVYIADRGNNRIVQASKEGRFKQQYRLAESQATEVGNALADATSLFVDEIVGHAYLLSGRKLYLLVLPMSE